MLCKYILKTLFTAWFSEHTEKDDFSQGSGYWPETSNFTCAETNIYLSRLKLFSSTVDSDGRTLHVPNLICSKKKYHPSCLKIGKYTGKPGNSCFDFSVICVLLWQGDS